VYLTPARLPLTSTPVSCGGTLEISRSCEKHLEMPLRAWFEFHLKSWISKRNDYLGALSPAYKNSPNKTISPNGRAWSGHRFPIRYSKIERPEDHCTVMQRHRMRKVLSRAPAPSEAKDSLPRIRRQLCVWVLLRKEAVRIISFRVIPYSWITENIPVLEERISHHAFCKCGGHTKSE